MQTNAVNLEIIYSQQNGHDNLDYVKNSKLTLAAKVHSLWPVMMCSPEQYKSVKGNNMKLFFITFFMHWRFNLSRGRRRN